MLVAPWRPLQFPQHYAREMLPKITLKREKAHTTTTETQQVSMNGNSALDKTSLGKTCDQYIDAIIAAQAGFDNLREIVDGRPNGIEALIDCMRETVFPSTEYEPERLFSQHCRSEGPLSQKNGESMEQYVSRGRRDWTPLTQMDPGIFPSRDIEQTCYWI